MRRIPLLVAIAAILTLGGCLGGSSEDPTGEVETNAEEDFLADAEFDRTDKWSHPLSEGSYQVSDPEEVFVTSPSPYEDEISIGIVEPADLGEDEQVPVIADVSPYYGELEGPVTEPTDFRMANFLIENFVPHGYAVALVSVPGTGNSGGCADFFGPREQAAVDRAITFLAEQEFTNGNVGLIGKSYDGGTSWEGAAVGNPHVETIVPMAGVPSTHALHVKNGTADYRTALLNSIYWSFGVLEGGIAGPQFHDHWIEQPKPVWAERVCPAAAEHVANGATGLATGGQDPTGYWATRSFEEEVLSSYEGSVFVVHGLQDWNAKPHLGVHPWKDLEVDKKLWLGQWSHIYPDRPDQVEDCEVCPYPEGVRWDFAEVLKRWFDSELKGTDVDTGPTVWSQDTSGGWHASDDWPPEDADTRRLFLADGSLAEDEPPQGSGLLSPTVRSDGNQAVPPLSWRSEPLEKRTRITGEPKLHFTVTPTAPDGNLIALLHDVSPNGEREHVGHAYMNLRYAHGGDEPREVTPGEEREVRMQFFPLDAVVPEGHRLELTLAQESSWRGGATTILASEPVKRPSGPMEVHWGEGYGSALIYEETQTSTTPLPWHAGGTPQQRG